MAKLWGKGTNGFEDKPNWLTPAQKENCYATAAGWVLKHNNGIEELLVAIKGLSLVGELGAATITELKWVGTYKEYGPGVIKISFNEKVAVTGNPTITVTHGGGTITGTFASINTNKTTLTFNITVPAIANSPLSVAAQSVALAGGTINEEDTSNGTVNAALAVSSALATALGTKAIVAAATPTAVAFSSGTYTAGTTKSVTVTYSGAVDVAVSNPTLVVHGSVTASTTATYASGTGTNTLVFNFTVPSAGQTLNIQAQSIVLAGGSTIKEAGSTTQPASLIIASGVATAAGTKTTV
jgi:hypothetical protein